MTISTFDKNASKYKCFMDLIHVEYAAFIISALAVIWYSVAIYDFFFVKTHGSLLSSCIVFICLIGHLFAFFVAFHAIKDSEPCYIVLAVVLMKYRIIFLAVINVLFLAALYPSSSVEYFIRDSFKKYFKVATLNEYDVTLNFCLLLVYFTGVLAINYWIYDVLNKCYKYYLDKAADAQLPQIQSVPTPPPSYSQIESVHTQTTPTFPPSNASQISSAIPAPSQVNALPAYPSLQSTYLTV